MAGHTPDRAPGDDSEQPVAVVVGAATGTGMAFSVKVAVRFYMAVSHLYSAQRSARMCEEREAELVADGATHVDHGHRSDAMNAVLCSVAFLEAFVNEAFADAAEPDRSSHRTAGLSPVVMAQMRQFWDGGAVPVERNLTVLAKYQLALLCAEKPVLDRGCAPVQAVEVLIELRNALVHFKPETQDLETPKKLARSLRQRITENQQNIGEPWFPNRALSAGCARWACDTAMALADEWQQRLGLTCDYRNELEDLES